MERYFDIKLHSAVCSDAQVLPREVPSNDKVDTKRAHFDSLIPNLKIQLKQFIKAKKNFFQLEEKIFKNAPPAVTMSEISRSLDGNKGIHGFVQSILSGMQISILIFSWTVFWDLDTGTSYVIFQSSLTIHHHTGKLNRRVSSCCIYWWQFEVSEFRSVYDLFVTMWKWTWNEKWKLIEICKLQLEFQFVNLLRNFTIVIWQVVQIVCQLVRLAQISQRQPENGKTCHGACHYSTSCNKTNDYKTGWLTIENAYSIRQISCTSAREKFFFSSTLFQFCKTWKVRKSFFSQTFKFSFSCIELELKLNNCNRNLNDIR